MEKSEFDEDIFHDTLLKCMDKFNTDDFNEDEFMPYITTAFKMNVIRSHQYHDVAMRSDTEIENVNEVIDDKHNIDYSIIIDDIKNKFGEDSCNKFLDWLDDKSIKEINETYECNNSRYLIDKIKEYIKFKYKFKWVIM